MRKLFVLNFNSRNTNTAKLHNAIITSSIITNWSHFLADSYILQSEGSAKDISTELRKKYGAEFNHYIFRIHKDYYGYMPAKQWEWIKNRADWWD